MKRTYINVADFETTTIPNSDNEVYSWALGDFRTESQIMYQHHRFVMNENVRYKEYKGQTIYYGISMKSFIDFVQTYRPLKTNPRVNIRFVNLGGFDGHFIKDYLIDNGYILLQDLVNDAAIYNEKFIKHRIEVLEEKFKKSNSKLKVYEYINKHWSEPQTAREFSFIWKKNKFKSIKLGLNVEFTDTLNLVRNSVADMGESLTKLYDCKDDYYKKSIGAISYDRVKLYSSLDELENDGKELSYLLQDIFVPMTFMHYYVVEKLINELGVDVKLTSGATSYNFWKKGFKQKLFNATFKKTKKRTLKNGKEIYDYWDTKTNRWIKVKEAWNKVNEAFMQFFPNTHQEAELMEIIRDSYRGGLTMLNPKFQGLPKKIKHYDINSSYPSVMRSAVNLFPYGEPLKEKPKGDYVYLVKFTLKRDCYNHKGMPFIPNVKGFGKSAQYPQKVSKIDKNGNNRELFLTNMEYEQFLKQYRVKENEINIIDKIYFKAATGDTFFDFYYDLFWDLKLEAKHRGDDILKDTAKIYLNSLYGYFARRWLLTEDYINPLDGTKNGWDYEVELEPIYLPMGIFITSYARMKLIKAAELSWEEFGLYCDTDSLFVMEGFKFPDEVKFDQEKLGYWDSDEDFDWGMFVKAKQYDLYSTERNIFKTCIAGIHFDSLPKDKIMKADQRQYWFTFEQMINGESSIQRRPSKKYNGVYIEQYKKDQKPIWLNGSTVDQESYVNDIGYMKGMIKEWTMNNTSTSMTTHV